MNIAIGPNLELLQELYSMIARLRADITFLELRVEALEKGTPLNDWSQKDNDTR